MGTPKRLDLGRGGLSPFEVARAYRQEHAGLFDDLDDGELIRAIEQEDPDTFNLIDPLLIGAENLPMRGAAPPPPPPKLIPPPPDAGVVVPTALRVVPAIGGAILGTLATGGPWGTAGGGMLGSGLGETGAQWYEKTFSGRDEYSVPSIAFESLLGAFNPAAKGATTLGRIGWQSAYGAGLGGVSGAAHPLIEEGRAPTLGEIGTGTLLGAGFGGLTSGAFEGASALARRAPSLPVEGMGGFGDVGGPPPPLSPTDMLPAAMAAQAQYQAEEAILASRLASLYGPDALRKPGQPDYHTAVQAKDYLEQLARLNQQPVAVPDYTAGLEPPSSAVQAALPAGRGERGPFTAYPPDALVEPAGPGPARGSAAPPPTLDQVEGPLPPSYPVVGGRLQGDVAGPPSFEHALQQSLRREPGPPRLVRPLTLTPPAPEPSVSRGTLPLLGSAPPSLEQAVQQTGRMGGRKATRAQPRLPGTETGFPADRPYTTGPNAGPRRSRELHGTPRKWRRQVQTGDRLTYETLETPLAAEDPGTYPADVRRELARIAYELDTYRWERMEGGLTRQQIDDYAATYNVDVATAVADLKRSGASSGGSIAGAPVYHEILKAAGGARSHATRAEMLADLRAALLEGKGSVLSDAAAQVARGRMAQEAQGIERGAHSLVSVKGQGDDLIGWVDESGARALPDQELDEWQRAARDADDQDILTALRVEDESVGVSPERYFEVAPYFEAMRAEAVRRGLIEPRQPSLKMLGPGAEGGPPIREEIEPALPGMEGVRGEERPMPRLAEPTFRLEPPPERPKPAAQPSLLEEGPPHKPRKSESNWLKAAQERAAAADTPQAQQRRRAMDRWLEEFHQQEAGKVSQTESGAAVERERQRIEAKYREEHGLPLRRAEDRELLAQALTPDEEWRLVFGTEPPAAGAPPSKPAEQPSLWRRLLGEEGVLILDIPAGDRAGLKRWLKRQESEHGGETWFSRVEQHIEDGEWDRAWKAAAAASATSYTKALKDATPRQEAVLRTIVHGTPLQDDLNAQIIAGARQRAGVGEAPKVKDFPPSKTVTQAGAARGKATLGPAGILNPGRRQRPLSSAAPELRAATLDRNVVRLIMEDLASPEGLATVPGNQDTYLRLFRQVGEQIYKGQNLRLLRDAGVRIPPEELAQHWNATISDAGRTLQLLSQFAQDNQAILTEAAERMSMGGALRGMLGGGPPPRYVGARGRVLSPEGQQAAQSAVEQVAERTNRYQATALANDMQKRSPVGPLRVLHDASYAWMLSKWNTAVRNYMSFTGRYSMDSLDHALTIPIARLTGDEPTAVLSSALLQERGVVPFQRGAAVTPKAAWSDELQTIYDFTTDNLNRLKPKDVRHALRLLLDAPEHMAEYLGTIGGEDLAQAVSGVPVLRTLANPKLQRFLTMFNRAQEFSARGVVFDATVRAQLRAKGLDPSLTLSKPVPEIIQAVGGQPAFDTLIFTATSQALEASFAGRTSKDSIPGWLIRMANEMWVSKLGVPFPRFNLSAAPRWIYDHSPAAILDWLRFPLDTLGVTAPKGTTAGGRLYRGVRAQQIQRDELPILQGKIGEAEQRQGLALQELLGTQREWNIRQRQVSRLQGRMQQGLPEARTALENAIELRDQLGKRRDRLKGEMKAARDVVGDLQSQQKKLLERVADATAINAPNYAQSLARMSVGVGILGAAMVVRSQPGAEGTRWYEFRVDREGQDPLILDFRPFAPFAQYLFVADVLNDFLRQTDWTAVHGEVAGGDTANPLAWAHSIWSHYEGKYTEAELGSQFAQAFMSISRAAGTTLTLTDLATQDGLPSIGEFSRAIVGTIGQFFSRFTVPGQQVSDVWGQFSEEESKIRTPPRQTMEELSRPLAAPLANVPYVRRVIPERISQTTGRPVATEYPLLRALAGIGTTPRDFVVEEVRRVGVPGQSVFIRETGDYGLDRAIAESYATVLQEELPAILEDPTYRELRTPARQRDFLQRTIFPVLKRVALAEARSMVGEDRYTEATVRGEEERRRARQSRLIEELEGELPAEDDPLRGSPPPAPPAGLQGGPVPTQ